MNEIKMNEIDPKLFVTCRLCLDNTGVYQIVPTVQKQIMFCFQIEVDPFDGFPQLICRDCELTLRKYFEVKTNYVMKQEKLRKKLEPPTQIAQSSKPEEDCVTSTRDLSNERNSKKRKRVLSPCDSDTSITNESVKSKEILKNHSKRRKESPEKLNTIELHFNKWFICRFCNYQWRYKFQVIRHVNMKHKSMKEMCGHLMEVDCYVKLDKLDNKPNICNSKRHVVLSSDRIVYAREAFYYVVVKPKNYFNTKRHGSGSSLEDKNLNTSEQSDDEIISKGCKTRRHRILSSDIVVNEKADCEDSSLLRDVQVHTESNASLVVESECICIDDSDTDSIKNNHVLKNADAKLNSSVNNSGYKTVKNSISKCIKMQLDKLEDSEADLPSSTVQPQAIKLDSLHKHKILSIGKKIINNSPFSCIGILRFLTLQNLEVYWITKIMKYSDKKSDFVIIMIELKSRDENEVQDMGWDILEKTNEMNISCNRYRGIENNLIQNINATCKDRSTKDITVQNKADVPEEQTALVADKAFTDKEKVVKKLLNENPVSNPKTLPSKKSQAPKFSYSKKKKTRSNDKPVAADTQNIETDCNNSLPIITSAVSLATVGSDADKQSKQNALPSALNVEQGSETRTVPPAHEATDNSKQQEPAPVHVPRIKVKPASQLLSNERNFVEKQNMQQPNMLPHNLNLNIAYQSNANVVYMKKTSATKANTDGYEKEIFNVSSHTVLEGNKSTNPQTSTAISHRSNQECIVLHSVDLPHTRTASPFGYFKRLLQMNNIYLLSPEEIMTVDFTCLLKFKIVFQQETTSPIVLCLAIFNSKHKFCVKIKDVYNKDLNIFQLSPNWQWEILKVCSGDVVSRMLNNAQKISSEVFEYTRKFLCYLNSIELKQNL